MSVPMAIVLANREMLAMQSDRRSNSSCYLFIYLLCDLFSFLTSRTLQSFIFEKSFH